MAAIVVAKRESSDGAATESVGHFGGLPNHASRKFATMAIDNSFVTQRPAVTLGPTILLSLFSV